MPQLFTSKGLQPRIMLRLVVITTSLLFYLLYRFLYNNQLPLCYRDAWHDLTYDLNIRLKNGVDDVVIGIGQVLMDGWIVTIILLWIVGHKNARIVWAPALFFLSRTVMMEIMAFPFPKHIVWHNPGFISLTVPYEPTRDFYYSGHTGSLTIIMLQLFTVNHKWLTGIALISLIYMMNMLTITRVHYTIDIAGGLVFAFFMHSKIKKHIFYGDWLLSLPYLLVRKGINKYRARRGQLDTIGNGLEERLVEH